MLYSAEGEILQDDRPAFVAPGLWLGSCCAEANLDALLGCGISHVVTVGVELIPSHRSRFSYLHIPVLDVPSVDLCRFFRSAFEFIEEGRRAGGVLVHCLAGISRSATIVIGYMMWSRRIPYHQARRHVAEVRPWIRPNRGFTDQLLAFQDAGCELEASDSE